MTLLIVYLLLALFVSFLCSVLEAVLLSMPMSYIQIKESEGHKAAPLLKKLKTNIDRPISAILSLNTIANTVGAAGVGAQATRIFGEAYFGLTSAILTILILVLSEILPKSVGAKYWRQLAPMSANTIQGMIIVAYPLVIVSEFITKIFPPGKEDASVSRQDISALAEIGTQEGIFADKENKIIQNLIRLGSVKVKDIMTPRVVVVVADENMPISEFITRREYLPYSRIPVFSENKENITGYVFRLAALEKQNSSEKGLTLSSIKRPITVCYNHQSLTSLWEHLLNHKEHIALVVDEYGGFDGIVTMEDIIESILGLEIVDERDGVTDMQQYARERWNEKKSKFILSEVPGDMP